MIWLLLLVGAGLIVWALVRNPDVIANVRGFFSEKVSRQVAIPFCLGFTIILVSAVILAYQFFQLRPISRDKIVLPTRVLRAFNSAIESGYLPRKEAAIVNEWLNLDVRTQPRQIEVVEVERQVATPVVTFDRIASSKLLTTQDRDILIAYLTDVVLNEHDNDDGSLEALCKVILTGTVTNEQAIAMKEFAENHARRQGLNPENFGIPESHAPKVDDHEPVPAAADLVPPPPNTP